MEEEKTNIVFDMVMNTIVVISKIYGGVLLGSYTLICGGYYSLCDLIRESISFFSSNVHGRKASEDHPFGYGTFEYNAGITIGLIFLLLGIYIIINSFTLDFQKPNIYVVFLLILIFIFKVFNADYLLNSIKKGKSSMLTNRSHNSFKEVLIISISTLFILLSRVFPIFDLLGCLFIGLTIIYSSLKIIINNFFYLKGQNDTSTKINNKIKTIINDNKELKLSYVDLINVKTYYMANITMELSSDIEIYELISLENSINKRIKKEIKDIKLINFEIIRK